MRYSSNIKKGPSEDDEGYNVFPDGSYMYEIEGIPEMDANEDIYITAKEPSRIQFSQQPIKVFTTYSVDDFDGKNEDVDPTAASAEYELEKRVEKMDLFDVQLEKGSEGLGLSIIEVGVGADAGLEKLGIFMKTLNEGGAAQRDGRIQVNDQIIEVDGKSLVGVTQAYAGSVLRNTNGQVNFLIGREKDPSKSEVARLIQQSLEQDKRRNEVRKRELEERQRQLEQLQLQVQQQKQMQQERQAMGQTPQPSSPLEESESDDDTEYVSPHEHEDTEENQVGDEDERTTAEVFQLDEGSSGESGDVTPEMNPQVLFIKLKEAQYKNAVSEAELAKLKAKMILLENADSQKKVFEKKYEDMASRLRETERNLTTTQKEITNYQEVLKGSQEHYVKLEQDIRDEYTQLEKKYHKSKKLIKDYQTRERDLLQEQESQYQQQSEKEQQYNQLVKSLKDKIFDLEKQLAEALKASGRSVPPPYSQTKIDMVMPVAVATSYQKPRPLETDNLSELSETDSSPESSPEKVIAHGGNRHVNGTPSDTSYGQEDLDCVPHTELLDVSPSKSKTHLASAGALAGRKPPSKTTSSTTSHESDEEDELYDRDDQSDTSSISQSSYDPSQPMFPSMGAEIPHVSPDTQEGGVMLISSRPRQDHSSMAPNAAGQPKALISGKASKAGGIQLISKKPVPNDFSADSGGIALLSTRSLDTGYGRGHLNTHSTDNLSASANMVAEYDLDNRAQKYDFTGATLTADDNSSVSSTGSASKRNVAYQASPVQEWSPQQVCHWLLALELDQYAQEFMANNIDGVSLLAIDSNRLKVLGVSSGKDRDTIRKRVKELRSAMEKERKALEREQKAREKLEKQSNAGKKKKFPFTKA